MAKTPKFPNPEFWKAKDNIDWKKQWEKSADSRKRYNCKKKIFPIRR